ncbi:MAG: alkaline phosphatase family protein [Actinomycetota bacterium]|nr:alkaline phosphatase family protein [Actinomycetota bacterium]
MLVGLALAGLAGAFAFGAAAADEPPTVVKRPVVSGTPVDGSTLTTTTGEWTGTEPISYAYQWRRCDLDGLNCVSIEGATSASYTLVAADLGFTLRARVIASNVAGKSYRGSLPTAVVEAALPLPGGAPCGTATAPPTGGWEHVVWIVFENKGYDDVIGSANAPYLNSLASECGLATNFYAEAHPSLPNYIAMTSGSTQGVTDNGDPASHPLDVPSIFSQLGTGGWRSLEESMPSNCYLTNSSLYAVRHNPAAYYTNVRTDCASYDVPLTGPPDLSARFTFVTPNLCNDMHSCSTQDDIATETKTGDTWLSTFLPQVLASPEYTAGTTAIFITWDEDDYSSVDSQHIPTLVVAPSTPAGAASATRFDHYSLLRTTEEMLGLTTYLGRAADATSMRGEFGL